MTDQDFRETVLNSLAIISNNIKWIIKIGSILAILTAMSAGTLWLRTENNAINIAAAETTINYIQQNEQEVKVHGE